MSGGVDGAVKLVVRGQHKAGLNFLRLRTVAFHAFLYESDSRLVVQDLLDVFEPEKCQTLAAVFGAVMNPKDAILRLQVHGDFGQKFLADA